jgi:general secretion pathway protein D
VFLRGWALNVLPFREGKCSFKRTCRYSRYNLDLRPATYYIKRVLRPFCLVALLLAALTSAFGQAKPTTTSAPRPLPTANQVVPAPIPSVPAKTEEAPAAVPPAQAQTSPPPPSIPNLTPVPDKTVTLQFPNSDVVDVLHLYEQLTGKKLIMDNFVQGKVNIFLSKAVPRDEAIKIIEINLLMNGYSLVPAGDDIVKVIGTGRSPRNAGVPLVSDEADIPDGEHVVTFLFKLRFADPVELQQVLGQYLQPPQSYTSFLALPKAGAILITENSSVIRTLIRIVDQIDVPPAQVVSEFIKLERADASKVVEMLKDVFEKGATTTTTTTVAPGVRPVRPPNVPQPPQTTTQVAFEGDLSALSALTEDSIVVGKIKIAADVRTNRIHVITRPVNMPFIKKLISEFDANVEFAKPVTRALRYISAAEVLPVIVQALTEPGTNQAAGPDTSNPAAPQQQAQQNQRRTTSTTPSTSGFDTSSSTSGAQNFSEELSTQAVDTTPKAVTIGNAKIIADQRSNSIIVLGNKEVVVKVGKILDEMDVSSPQVALSTVIGELTLNNNEEFGIDWFGRGGEKRVGTTNFTGVPPYAGGSTSTSSNGTTTTSGGSIFFPGINFTQLATSAAGGANVYLAAGNSLAAVVHALNTTGRFKTISRPTVFTSNNKKAIIASGTEIPVPVNTIQGAVGTTGINNGIAQTSNIQFKKVALQLEVVPLINSEKEVTLDILQKLDSLAGSTVVSGNSIPNIATRYIKTTVSAPNCSTIVLGGLITDDRRRDTTGIPVLSKIPIIGGLFRETNRTKSRAELIILMRPEVSLTQIDLKRLRQKNEDKTHFGPELDQDDCPDCEKPAPTDDKQIVLPGPDLPGMK